MPTATKSKPTKSKKAEPLKLNKISSDKVKEATGKTWEQWLKLLDAAGCKKMDHKGIVAVLSEKFEVGPWWQQMVTVGYEQARGLRAKGQTPEGYQVSASKTIAAPAREIFEAWTNDAKRAQWMKPAKFTISKATPNKSIRIKWDADDSRVSVMLYPKGADRCSVTVDHIKMKSAATAERTKKCWAGCLNDLAQHLEGA